MAYNRRPNPGQATMANSEPVVIASDQSPLNTVEAALMVTGQAAQTAVVNNILTTTSGTAATDLQNYRTATVQVVSTGTGGTFIFEQSNDNVNFIALPVFNAALVTGVPITAAITATASQIIYTFPVRARYVRLRIATTITGGSIQAHSRFSTEPWTATAQLVASNVAANNLVTATVASTTLTAITPGTAATNSHKARDAAAAATDTNQGIMGIVRAAPTTVTPVAGDYEVPQLSTLGALFTHPVAVTAGGATPFRLVSAATTNATSVKTSAGQVYSITAMNTNAAVRYLKLYNLAVAPTVGTSTPVQVYALPPSGGLTLSFPVGMAFSTGIALATTTGAADTDTGAVALNEIVISLTFL